MFGDGGRSGERASMSITTRSVPILAATAALGLSAAPALATTSHHGTDRGQGNSRHHAGYGSQNGTARAYGLDRAWLKHIAQSDLAEIATGTLAQQKGTSEGVKSLGAMLVADHTKHLQQVQAIAAQVGATVPTAPSAEQQWEASVLATFSGAAFDEQWTALQVAAHVTNIDKTQDEIADGHNRLVRELARMTLPTLQAHLAAAQKLSGDAGRTAPSSDSGTQDGSGAQSDSGRTQSDSGRTQSDCNRASGDDGQGSSGDAGSSGSYDRRHAGRCCHDGSDAKSSARA
jgi:putative membrane protein